MSIRELSADMMFESAVELFAKTNMLTIKEAKDIISNMSFAEYVKIMEASAMITPPSGQMISPSANSSSVPTNNTNNTNNSTQQNNTSPTNTKAIWPGNGSPVKQGMIVGLKGPNGIPLPGEVTQVDTSAKGVKVRNPTTGQDEWQNNDNLEPYMVKNSNQPQQNQPQQNTQTQEDKQLMRLKELAGIREDASCGATGAGSIAVSTAPLGKMKRRQETDEALLKKEYTPKVAKTAIGDTKPNQASGELSANLAASGKKSAGRINNGRKRT